MSGDDTQTPLLRRVADYDPFADHRITPRHYYLLERIGDDGLALSELRTLGTEGAETLAAELQAWGAIVLDDSGRAAKPDPQPAPEPEATPLARIALASAKAGAAAVERPPPADPAAMDADETRLLAEVVELSQQEKLRLLGLRRALDTGGGALLDGQVADKRSLRRAYYELAVEHHPERYRGKRLGSFGPLIGEIFAAASQAVKALSDTRTTTAPQLSHPHRRRSRRVQFRGRVAVRAQSWDGGYECTSQDLSLGGLFVVTERSAMAGEAILIEMQTKAGTLRLRGTVAWCRPAGRAENLDRSPGIGVRLAEMPETDAEVWNNIVEKVGNLQPTPSAKPLRPEVVTSGNATFRRPPIIGIDLGTTRTSVCATVNNRVTLLPFPDGSVSIPSVVAFPAPGRFVVGEAARSRLLTDPRHTVASVKRLLGRKADDKAISGHLAQAAYSTKTGPDGYVLVELWNEDYHLAQLCAYLLGAARDAAEQALDTQVRETVLAVPTSFTPARMAMLRRAAKVAQLEVVDIMEEPNAAALANQSYPDFGGLVGIFDFGGGTFDFSVIDASSGDFRVLATSGDSWLGGDDLDLAMAEALANLVWRERQIDLRQRAVEWQKLLFSCEQAKCRLSARDEATVLVEEYAHSAEGPLDLRVQVTRERAEELWRPVIERTIATCNQALNLLSLDPEDLSQIYLSGGSAYVPAVRRALASRFPVPVRSLVPPEYAVSLGCGVQAASIEKRRPARRSA